MTPPRRVDWLRFGFWTAVLCGALAFACVVVAGLLFVGQRILAVVWPFFVAHSDGLALGLGIAVVLAALMAVNLEGKRR